MPPDFPQFLQSTWIVLVDILTLAVLVVGLVGLIMPVFPGLVVMWLATLVYALLQGAAGQNDRLGLVPVCPDHNTHARGQCRGQPHHRAQNARSLHPMEFHPLCLRSKYRRQHFLYAIHRSGCRTSCIIPGGNEKIERSRRCNHIHKSLYGWLGLGFWRQGFNWSCNDRLLDVVGLGMRLTCRKS